MNNNCKWILKYLIYMLHARLFYMYYILGDGFTSIWDVLLKRILGENRCSSKNW